MSLMGRKSVPISVFIRLWGDKNREACEFIRLARANAGSDVITPQVVVRGDVYPEIVGYLLSESRGTAKTASDVGLEMIREGLEFVLSDGWSSKIAPIDAGIELLHIAFEARLAEKVNKMLEELGIE